MVTLPRSFLNATPRTRKTSPSQPPPSGARSVGANTRPPSKAGAAGGTPGTVEPNDSAARIARKREALLSTLRLMTAVVFTLILGVISFAVGGAWNSAFLQMAQRKKFPLWAYALSATVVAIGLSLGIAIAAHQFRIAENIGTLGDAARVHLPIDDELEAEEREAALRPAAAARTGP